MPYIITSLACKSITRLQLYSLWAKTLMTVRIWKTKMAAIPIQLRTTGRSYKARKSTLSCYLTSYVYVINDQITLHYQPAACHAGGSFCRVMIGENHFVGRQFRKIDLQRSIHLKVPFSAYEAFKAKCSNFHFLCHIQPAYSFYIGFSPAPCKQSLFLRCICFVPSPIRSKKR